MVIILKRAWNSVGVWGTLMALAALVEIYQLIFRPSPNGPGVSLITIPVFLVSLVRFVSGMRGYQRLEATKSYDELDLSLRYSTEEFGLILRPFGADGETFLRQYETTRKGTKRLSSGLLFSENLTMEQVLAEAVRKAAQQKVYALVDQHRELAPPGPVYVRVPNADWQEAIRKLMKRAYAIFLWLPAGQEVRDGLSWEIEQIVQAGLQKRTIILMPPPNNKAAHQRAVKDAALLLAAMETATGKMTEADPLRVQYYQGMLGDRATTMKFVAAEDGTGLRLVRRMVAEPKRLTWQRAVRNVLLCWLLPVYILVFSDLRRNGRVNVLAYEQGLVKLLAAIRNELAGQPFSARYPNYQPGVTAGPVPGSQSIEPLDA
jgi:hypothetical protein